MSKFIKRPKYIREASPESNVRYTNFIDLKQQIFIGLCSRINLKVNDNDYKF